MDLLLIIVASVVLVPLVILGEGVVRIILGLIFVLFIPGYSLMAALFPKRSDLGGVERLALSFGLSIAVVPLIGLILNYTPWGIRLYPTLFSILAFIIVMAGIAWYRRRRLPVEQRFGVQFSFKRPELANLWARRSVLDRVLTVLLVVAILGTIGTLVYVVQTPKIGEQFTEFYILGEGGKAENYPRALVVGEEAKVTAVIVNHEQKTMEYRVRVTVDGKQVQDISPIILANEEKWEQEVTFTATRVGENQRVEFQLYQGADGQLEHTLRLWIDVAGK